MSSNYWRFYPHYTYFVDRRYYYPFFYYPNYYHQNIYRGSHNMLYDPPIYHDRFRLNEPSNSIEHFSDLKNNKYIGSSIVIFIIVLFLIIFLK